MTILLLTISFAFLIGAVRADRHWREDKRRMTSWWIAMIYSCLAVVIGGYLMWTFVLGVG